MAHDVFISYGNKDKTVADAVCARLEGHGVRCWIAPRDLRPGMQYGSELAHALKRTKVLVLILSSHANYSKHVAREVEQAVHFGAYVLPFRIEEVKPTTELSFFINSTHWLDALTPPLEHHLEQLRDSVDRILHNDDGGAAAAERPSRSTQPAPAPAAVVTASPRASRPVLVIAAIAAVTLAGAYALFKPASEVSAIVTPAGAQAQPTGGGTDVASSPAPAQGVGAEASRGGTAPGARSSTGTASSQTTSNGAAKTLEGCWRYPNGIVLQMVADGSVQGAPVAGRWKSVESDRYLITWPTFTDRVLLSVDGQKVTGVNNYGLPVAATRTDSRAPESGSLVGAWRYNNIPAVVADDGSIVAGAYKGKWRTSGAGTFVIDWEHRLTDDLTLANAGNTLMGSNSLGVVVSAARATCGA